jgi:hypothetical protein
MRTLATIALFLSLVATAFAATWTGKLVDANCADRDKSPAAQPAQPGQPGGAPGQAADSCAVTQSTSSFAIQTTDGKILKLDAAGNSKAAAVRNAKGNVQVTGDLEGQTVKVESISPMDAQNKGGAPGQQEK